ncbi:MAG: hypothetical protein R6V05_15400 [Candidatus Brocadiia bacterium]
MGKTMTPQNAVSLECVCGEELTVEADALGRIMRCPRCDRYLRPGLQFLLVDERKAPNLTVQCECGHFVVAERGRAGKRVQCPVCKQKLVMPQAVVKHDSPGAVRVPRRALERQLRRVASRPERRSKEMTRLESAAHAGRITLRPGEHICVNLECGALMKAGAIVCPKCGTNRITGERYESPGPEADPEGRWKQV